MDNLDGDFKKGRFGPAAVVVALLLAAGGAGAVYMGWKTGESKMSVDQINSIKKGIYVLPIAEQVPRWKQLAEQGTVELKQEALLQLFFLKDKEVVAVATKALADPDHKVRGVAAQIIATTGMPDAEPARAALIKAFKETSDVDRPQVSWALCVLAEKTLRKELIDIYKKGEFTSIERAGGGRAFDIEAFAKLGEADDWAAMAADPSPSIRQLVAGILSNSGEKRHLGVLTKLVNDPQNEVARDAAAGLGKIGDTEAVIPLIQALTRADKDDRDRFLNALRDSIGGKGLVLAFGSVAKEPLQRNRAQTQVIFDMLKQLADPRAGDALVDYLEKQNPPPHFFTEAALRLAEVGDPRAVPYLAKRMTMDPTKVYNKDIDPEFRSDDERVVSARMLADLAVLHPDKRAEMRAKAEDSVMGWMKDKLAPHANGLRFLAASESKKYTDDVRKWANPSGGIPGKGTTDLPWPWITAQSALRYLGWMKDEVSWPTLDKQLTRKPLNFDGSQQGIFDNSAEAAAGMVYRGLTVGAAQGFAHWGDNRAFAPLLKVAEDPKNHEGARDAACASMSWVANEANLKEVVQKAKAASGKDPKTQVLRACLLETLTRKPVAGTSATLVEMLDKNADPTVRVRVGRALGWVGLDQAAETALFEKLKDDELSIAAALALVLGGSPEMASRTVATFGDRAPEILEELKGVYYSAFNYISDEDISSGRLFRWMANAEAIGVTRVRDVYQDWAKARLSKQIATLEQDNGPHSVTRVVLRYKLMEMARTGDAAAKKGAITALKFMGEQGVLMALKEEKGDHAAIAKTALFELLNPKALSDKVPDKDSKKDPNAFPVQPEVLKK